MGPRRRRIRWRRAALGVANLAALALGLAATGACASGDLGPRVAPRDYLTDVADDGSLVKGLVNRDPAVRRIALGALANLPPGENVAAVHERVAGESDAGALAALCFALGRWRDPTSGPVLQKLAAHPTPAVRAAALDALGRLGDDRALPLATAALGDPTAEVRAAAALAIFRLDGVRYERARLATDEQLVAADAALARAALKDHDPGVRWRATYALGAIRPRPGRGAVLSTALQDESPLVRTFALRGLAATGPHAEVEVLVAARRMLEDTDPAVAVEAAAVVVDAGTLDDVLGVLGAHRSSNARRLAAEALRRRLLVLDAATEDAQGPFSQPRRVVTARALADVAAGDPSAMMRREALATLAVLERRGGGGAPVTPWADAPGAGGRAGDSGDARGDALDRLADSADDRDRERAARLLADGDLRDDALLVELLSDPVPAVRAAALGALDEQHKSLWAHLEDALASADPALTGTAAERVAPLVREGRAPPRLANATAEALDMSVSYEMAEARVALASALGLPDLGTPDTSPAPPGSLLDRLVAEHTAARADPTPRVELETTRGTILLELDRLAAPRHVASFLELVQDDFYEGLDFHRVVPNFVVQGLDPRGDGWGTGGRRLPDEFGPQPFLTGSLGMPRTQAPHTGGCQVFLTHVPTPHLDGEYTLFGRVVEGQAVVEALEIGDVVVSARRVSAR